ncbi:PEP-CTERM sorting domain-containing protein [Catenovulum sediminis]|uniref:PEP-CTERM sorting domain-containing protein n=1 Tax=Catenovulum sediminis TaxID=1740262 RepID=A0ABV1RM96_9ALTE
MINPDSPLNQPLKNPNHSSFLCSILFAFVFFNTQPVFATPTCEPIPSPLIGTYTISASECRSNATALDIFGQLYNRGTVTNTSDGDINIGSGFTGEFYNENTLINYGRIVSQAFYFENDKTFINEGTMNYAGGVVSNLGETNNKGDMTVSFFSEYHNEGTVTNQGNFMNDGHFFNTGNIANTGAFINNGILGYPYLSYGVPIVNDIANSGILINNDNLSSTTITNTGALTNNGTLTNTDAFTNSGTITNDGILLSGNTLTNYGTITNSGSFSFNEDEEYLSIARLDNAGILNNTSDGVLNWNTNALIINSDTIENHGDINIGSGLTGEFYNENTLTNYGRIVSQAFHFANDKTFNNEGTMHYAEGIVSNLGETDNKGGMTVGLFSEYHNEGTVTNQGNFINDGRFINTGNIVNTGAFVNNGTLDNPYVSFGVPIVNEIANSGILVNNGDLSSKTITNSGTLTNNGTLTNADALNNNGILDNQGTIHVNVNASINNTGGVVNNAGTIEYAGSSLLDGTLHNSGIIHISPEEVLTLSGNLSGSGSFVGDTYLNDITINPGNSPGQLSFTDSIWDDVVLNIEFGRASDGSLLFDSIFIDGDLTLFNPISLSFNLLDGLSWDDLSGTSFDFFAVAGNVADADGAPLAITEWFNGLSDGMNISITTLSEGWSFALNFVDDSGSSDGESNSSSRPTAVPEPSTLALYFIAIFTLFLWRRRAI